MKVLSLQVRLAGAALAGAMALAATPAQARDVYWSVGVQAPVVGATISNAPPVVYAPAPVYMPAPVVVAPAPRVVYAPPPVVYTPPPRVVYVPAPTYIVQAPPHKHWKHKHHGHGHGEWRHGGHYQGGAVGHVRHGGGRWDD